MKKLLLAVATVTLLAGCSKLTKENYDKIDMGMDKAEVVKVIGQPDNCDTTLGVETCVWGDESKKFIKVRFTADTAVTYESGGLK